MFNIFVIIVKIDNWVIAGSESVSNPSPFLKNIVQVIKIFNLQKPFLVCKIIFVTFCCNLELISPAHKWNHQLSTLQPGLLYTVKFFTNRSQKWAQTKRNVWFTGKGTMLIPVIPDTKRMKLVRKQRKKGLKGFSSNHDHASIQETMMR